MSYHIVNHPIAAQALTVLRDKTSTVNQFRDACQQAVPIVLLEATKNVELKDKPIETPLCPTTGRVIANDIIIVPILRAGVSMLTQALTLLPFARVGYFGLQRDEQTALPFTYYQKLPPIDNAHVILIDPMLATGGSSAYALTEILKMGKPKSVAFCSIVAAPEGVQAIREKFPDVDIYTLAEDECLNEHKFIVPGLGDFGDRFHGTDY